jgi:hypothetical protein
MRVRRNVDQVAEHPDVLIQWPKDLTDYGDLIHMLDGVYIPIDVYAQSLLDFERLHQDSLPFSEYIAKFVKLADICEYEGRQRVEALKAKLNNEFQTTLISIRDRPVPQDFEGWVQLLKELSNNIAESKFRRTQH